MLPGDDYYHNHSMYHREAPFASQNAIGVLKMVLKLFSLLPPKRRKNDLATLPGMNHPFSENNESDIISHFGC